MTETLTLRPFLPADIPAGRAMTAAEGWPHRVEDWAAHLARSCGVAIGPEGAPLACALVTSLGDRVASLSYVLVRADARGRGLGRRAVEAALDLPAARGKEIRLCATEAGRPLYEKLGFDGFDRIAQIQGVLPAAPAVPAEAEFRALTAADAAAVAALDAAHLHADRAGVIAGALADPAVEAVALVRGGGMVGWAARRRFGRGEHVGPVVAPDLAGAEALLRRLMAGRAGAFVRVDATGRGLARAAVAAGLAAVGEGLMMRRAAAAPAPTVFGLSDQSLG